MNNKGIVLIGFMGSGKSSTGEELALLTGRHFIDSDLVIEEKAGKSIAAIFDEEGEDFFRELECRVIREIFSDNEPAKIVIATGGGAVLKEENRHILRDSGVVVWLTASPEEVVRRVKGSDRPLMRSHDQINTVKKMLSRRETIYRSMADYIIDTEGLTAVGVASAIKEKLFL